MDLLDLFNPFSLILKPIIWGVGWAVVIVITLGFVKPKKERFYDSPVVGLIGIYSCCALPPLIYLALKYFGFYSAR